MVVFSRALVASADDNIGFLEERIIGKWVVEVASDSDVSYRQLFSFSPDGSFSLTTSKQTRVGVRVYRVTGLWEVKNDIIFYRIHSSTHPNIHPGTTDFNQILRLSEREVVTRGKDGVITVAKKVEN